MRWRCWWMIGALAMAMTVGCGDDEDPVGNQDNDSAQNQNNDDPNQDNSDPNQENTTPDPDDDFAEAVDVWVGAHIGNEDNLTELDDGQSFGGRFVDDGAHYFSFDVSAGQFIELAIVELESDLEDAVDEVTLSIIDPQGAGTESMYFGGSIAREMSPEVGGTRRFFTPVAGAYTIEVDAPGGEEGEFGFAFEIAADEVEPDAGTLELPGSTQGMLSDGKIDVYEVSPEETTSIALELLAQQLADPSPLHGWVYVWDVAQGKLVAQSNGKSEELVDPQRDFALQGGEQYWLVVDMVAHVDDADYEVITELLATSADNPKVLSLDGESQFQGTIEERSDDYYSDYLQVSVAPGEYKRLTVTAEEAMEPAMLVPEVDSEAGFIVPYVVLPVDGVASVLLGVDEEYGEAMVFDIEISDVRNLEAHPDSPFGGSDFGYAANLIEDDPQIEELSSSSQTDLSLAEPGALIEVRTTVGTQELLWLDGGVEIDIEPGGAASQLGFIPSWGVAGGSTLAGANLINREHQKGYFRGSGAEQSFWFRDAFFRGGNDYDSQVQLHSFDVDVQDTTELSVGNEELAMAASIAPGVRITGEFTSEELAGAKTYYFSISASPGDRVAVVTEHEAGLETSLSLLDGNGDLLAEDAELLEQYQSGDVGDGFYDRALVYEVEAAGEYILAIEQSCGGGSCDTGQAAIDVVVE